MGLGVELWPAAADPVRDRLRSAAVQLLRRSLLLWGARKKSNPFLVLPGVDLERVAGMRCARAIVPVEGEAMLVTDPDEKVNVLRHSWVEWYDSITTRSWVRVPPWKSMSSRLEITGNQEMGWER